MRKLGPFALQSPMFLARYSRPLVLNHLATFLATGFPHFSGVSIAEQWDRGQMRACNVRRQLSVSLMQNRTAQKLVYAPVSVAFLTTARRRARQHQVVDLEESNALGGLDGG